MEKGIGISNHQDAETRLVLIGIDSATWRVMTPLIERGELPAFKALMDVGAYGPLRTFQPTLSPLIWNTISTGKSPEKHGMRSFSALQIPGRRRALYEYRWEQLNAWSRLAYRIFRLNWWKEWFLKHGVIKRVPLTNTFRRCKAVWNIASDHNQRVGFLGWWNSWPAERVNGFWISQYVELLLSVPPADMSQAAYPAHLVEEARPFIHEDEQMDPRDVRRFFNLEGAELEELATFRHSKFPLTSNYTPTQYLKLEYLCHEFRRQAAKHFYREFAPNLLGIFLSADPVQHFFWHCMEPEHFESIPEGDIEKYSGAIGNWYRYLDEIVSDLLEEVGESATVVIVSDHGHGPSGELPWSGSHDDAPDGIIILSGRGVKPIGRFEGASVYDVTPTILALMGLPIGRDMDGRVLSETIAPAFLEEKPLMYVDTHDQEPRGDNVGVSSGMDGAVIQRLKDLGYFE